MTYAAFRAWLVGKVASGASPKEVSAWLRRYRDKYSETAEAGWADGKPEVPTEEEIESLASKTDW
mgnify:CR=1 FL=1